jgi:hypothetical protein
MTPLAPIEGRQRTLKRPRQGTDSLAEKGPYEAGRRIFLNLFISDIILREEFGGCFTYISGTATDSGGNEWFKEKQAQWNNGLHCWIWKRKRYIRQHDSAGSSFGCCASKDKHRRTHCVAEAASLYKTRVDAGKANKRIWWILSNSKQWQFVLIDEDGLLWQSEDFQLDLRSYDESKVLQVFRIVHYIVKCCYEVCTTPTSTASSVVSLNQ